MRLVAAVLALCLSFAPLTALGHSGGTDSSGCHTNSSSGDYHCHSSGGTGDGGDSGGRDLDVGAIVLISLGVAAFVGVIAWLATKDSGSSYSEIENPTFGPVLRSSSLG